MAEPANPLTPPAEPNDAALSPEPRKRHLFAKVLLALFLMLLCVLGVAVWYASTPEFAARVRAKLVSALEDATGGRVEIGAFTWNLHHLLFEVDNLTIHGLEAPNEVPYAHVDKLIVGVKIINLLKADVGLKLLHAEHPVVHLIVYKDGTTNQPQPKTKSTSNKSTIDTVFDLAVDRTEILNGVALLNQQATPFNAAGNNLQLDVTYDKLRDHYLANATLEDLSFKMGTNPELHSRLEAQIDMARNASQLTSFTWRTGGSVLTASANVQDFNHPHWTLKADGNLDLHEAAAAAGSDMIRRGTADLHLTGNGSGADKFQVDGKVKLDNAGLNVPSVNVSALNANTSVHLNEREISLPDLFATLQEGEIKANLRYTDWRQSPATKPSVPLAPYVTPVTPKETLPQRLESERQKLKSHLRHGRAVESAKASPGQPPTPVQPAGKPHGVVDAEIRGITLRAILDAVAPPKFRDIGIDTSATGKVHADWYDTPDSANVSADVALTPSSSMVVRGEVPLSGNVQAAYEGRTSHVAVSHIDAHTPATHFTVDGTLGVARATADTDLHADVTTTNLGEFDRLYRALGVSSNGKSGAAAIPIHLEGSASFHGDVSGPLNALDIKGHLQADNFDTQFAVAPAAATAVGAPASTAPPLENLSPAVAPSPVPGVAAAQPGSANPAGSPGLIHWDSLRADAEYTPSKLAVGSATLVRGKTVVQAHGNVQPYRTRKNVYVYDDRAGVDASASIANAPLTDLEAIAGMAPDITGTLNINGHVTGTMGNPSGSAHLALAGGSAYGEPYRSLTSDVALAGATVNITQLTLLQNGGKAQGTGSYNYKQKSFNFDLNGSGFELSHFKHVQQISQVAIAGGLAFHAHASGTAEAPVVNADLSVTNIALNGQQVGQITATAQTKGDTVYLTSQSTLQGARLQMTGNAQLRGDYPGQLQASLQGFDVGPLMQIVAPNSSVKATTNIGLNMNVSGPFKQAKLLRADITVAPFTGSVAEVKLQGEGPIHATLANGVVRLDPMHVTGTDTDLRASGTIDVLGTKAIAVHADGTINLAIAQTVDPDIVSSGKVLFKVDAGGTTAKPDLNGDVTFNNAAIGLLDFPNGLSQMNGHLVFNEGRLEIDKLTAQTGGGELALAGYLTYMGGLYADLTATGTDVRVRYPQGISSHASTKLHLQGSQASMLLSGDILLTRFAINQDLDLSAFAGPAGVEAPPDPKSPSSHIRLDVHVTSSPQLNFQNAFATLAGDVDLRVRGTVAAPVVLGRVNITEGSATFNSVKYELQRGDIYFSNPIHIEPIVDLDATARVSDYDVTIGLHGSVSKLSVSYRSEPPLSQADVIALLASGRTQEEAQIYQQQQAAAGVNSTTDAILGGALNATVSNRVQRLFGLGSVKIDPTFVGSLGNSTARITVQQRVANNTTLTYATNVNSTAQQLIQAQYDITRNTSLVVARDESNVFSLVVRFRKRLR